MLRNLHKLTHVCSQHPYEVGTAMNSFYIGANEGVVVYLGQVAHSLGPSFYIYSIEN